MGHPNPGPPPASIPRRLRVLLPRRTPPWSMERAAWAAMVRRAVLVCLAVVALLPPLGFDPINPVPARIGSAPGRASRGRRTYSRYRLRFPRALSPAQLRRLLGVPQDATGAGARLVLIEQEEGFARSALAAFDTQFRLPPAQIRVVNATGTPIPAPMPAADETMLDVEWAHALAPEAQIDLVLWRLTPGCGRRLAAALGRLRPDAVSLSFAVGPPLALLLARDGATSCYWPLRHDAAFVAAGDGGPGLTLPAMLPFVTAVGGVSRRHNAWVPWAASGGGVADGAFPRPPWQRGVGSSWRAIPDVSWLAGAPGVSVYVNGWVTAAGTSLATPLWAALWADADAMRRVRGLPPLRGPAAPILYRLATQAPGALCLPAPRGAAGCAAAGGWRPGVGLGIPVPTRLLRALVRLPRGCCPTALPPAARPLWHALAATGLGLVALLLAAAASAPRRDLRAGNGAWGRLRTAAGLWVLAALSAAAASWARADPGLGVAALALALAAVWVALAQEARRSPAAPPVGSQRPAAHGQGLGR
jgi:hypothetical protein